MSHPFGRDALFLSRNFSKNMDNSTLFILGGAGGLILIIIAALRKHYRKIIKTKERGIIHHLREQDRLANELASVNAEKKVMEKMLASKFDTMVMINEPNV
jgi:gluconate kinase